MDAVLKHLIRTDDQLIPLFTPPFDTAPINPGYIKGYVPGVRENAGHYSHAAIWVVMAFAALNDHEQAWNLLSYINPIHHSKTVEDVKKYRVEPYVIASDMYAAPPHTGRGGWTWYSGSSAWMYSLILESLLGVQIYGDLMRFTPCIPIPWESYQIMYRYRTARYHITVNNQGSGSTVRSVIVDGISQNDLTIHLEDDQRDHHVLVELAGSV